MKVDKVYIVDTYNELLKCAECRLDVPVNSKIEVKKDLVYQVRDLIMKNQCKDADILAPYLNRFFVNDKDKLIKDMVAYYIPEFGMTVADKYEPYERLERIDYVAMWLPKGLWEHLGKTDIEDEWLSQSPQIILKD